MKENSPEEFSKKSEKYKRVNKIKEIIFENPTVKSIISYIDDNSKISKSLMEILEATIFGIFKPIIIPMIRVFNFCVYHLLMGSLIALKPLIRPFVKYIVYKVFIPVKEYNFDKELLKNNSFILCPNHLSELDKFYFWANFKDTCFAAKIGFFDESTVLKRVGSHIFKREGAYPIIRGSGGASPFHYAERFFMKTIKKGKKPKNLTFVQGTISHFLYHQNPDTVKEGAFFFSKRVNAQIIPIYFEQFCWFKRTAVVYGEPIPVDLENEKVVDSIIASRGYTDKVNEMLEEIMLEKMMSSKKIKKKEEKELEKLIYWKYRILWLLEMNRLHEEAERLEKRPMRTPIGFLEHQRKADEKARQRRLKRMEMLKAYREICKEEVKKAYIEKEFIDQKVIKKENVDEEIINEENLNNESVKVKKLKLNSKAFNVNPT